MPYNSNYLGSLNEINKFTYYSKITKNNVVLSLSPGIKWGVPTFGIKFTF